MSIFSRFFGRDEWTKKVENASPPLPHRSYDEYFTGYSLYRELRENGKGYRVSRVYEGDLYQQQLKRLTPRALRLYYAFSFFAAAAMYVVSLILGTVSNRCWYVMFPAYAALVLFVVCFFAVIAYLPSGREMTYHEFHSGSQPLQIDTAVGAGFIALEMLCTVLMLILQPGSWRTAEILRFLLQGVSGVLLFLIGKTERAIRYKVILGRPHAPEEASGEREEFPSD